MSHTFHRYRAGDEPVAGYRLTDHLGAGGFGEVWKATAPGGTEVALKIIDLTGQQGVQEFSSLRVVKKVRHPNLISLQAFWMKDEGGQIVDEAGDSAKAAISVTTPNPDPKRQTSPVGIAMTANFARPVELIIAMQLGSMSLHRRLEECREQGMPGVPVAELLEYLEQAARGIDFLNKPIHDLGKGPVPIVHGDVKPHNILVVGDAAVVCDFGLARAVETLRKTSMAPVTVAYAAPESFKGKVTPTSDQYSLAITYAELRTGRLPFDETMTPYQVMEAHVMRTLDFSRLPEPEQMVIRRATEPTPEDRWPSSRELILALRHAVAKTGELPLRPGEIAYTGGPTPSHSLTARPHPRETGLPTQVPVDPHKDTMHPGGRTPAHILSQQTSPSPKSPERPDADLAETSMLGPGLLIPPPRKKSPLAWIGAAAAGLALILGGIFVPKMLSEKPVANANGKSTKSVGQSDSTGGENQKDTEEDEPATGKNAGYIKDVRAEVNAGRWEAAVDLLDKAPSSLADYEKENLQKRLRTAFLGSVDAEVQRRSFAVAYSRLEDVPSAVGVSAEDKQAEREKIRMAWLSQAREDYSNEQWPRAVETAQAMLKRYPDDVDAQFVVARSQLRQNDAAGATATLSKLGKTADLPADMQPLYAGLSLVALGAAGGPIADSSKTLDDLLSYAALAKDRDPSGPLALNSWEQNRLAVFQNRLTGNVEQLLKTLPADQLGGLWEKLQPLETPERMPVVARLLLDAAIAKRTQPAATNAAGVLANPFSDAATADDAFQRLELARKISEALDKPGQKLTDAEGRNLSINLALAASLKSMPDEKLAGSLSESLMKLRDAELGPSLFPALFVAFWTHRATPAEQPIAIAAAQRILEPFQKQLPVADAQAVVLYKEVLGPALALADELVKTKSPPPELDKFYAAVAEFIGHYQQARWPFADKQKEMELLLTKAIELNPKGAKYYTTRGVARISQTPPNVEGALADAAEAGKIDPEMPAAYALQGHALIYRSRQQPTREARIADLEKAVAMCKASVDKSKPDDNLRGMHLLNLSMAQLERSNVDNDPAMKKDLLEKSVANAQQAVELEKDKAYPDYAYTALANALEDMAWLVGVEPAKNYEAAIDRFSDAIASNPAAADPLIGRARCFYKAVADSKIDPIQGRTGQEAMQAAIADLQQAQQLNASLVEPNLWLGKAYQHLKKYVEADAALGQAVKLADEQKLPERAMYMTEWARNARLNDTLSAADRTKTVRERAKQLKEAPSLGGLSTTKQAALLIGEALQLEGKLADALKEYDAALTDYDKADPAKPLDPAKADSADTSLLLARAAGRYSAPPSEWNLTAAEAVLKDIDRVIQLKPGPSFEAVANWYSANAKSRSLLSTSTTFTADKIKDFKKEVVGDVQKAIELAPNDPNSWQWRKFGAQLLTARMSVAGTTPETVKSLGPQARRWIDDAIAMAGKRPDLSGEMASLQRVRQDLDSVLAKNGLPRT